MVNKNDVSKLFQESFTGFFVENSPQIEAMMQKKLKRRKVLQLRRRIIISVVILFLLSAIMVFWPFTNIERNEEPIIGIKKPVVIIDNLPVGKNISPDKTIKKPILELENSKPNKLETEFVIEEALVVDEPETEILQQSKKIINRKKIHSQQLVPEIESKTESSSKKYSNDKLEFLESKSFSFFQIYDNRQKLGNQDFTLKSVTEPTNKKSKKYHIVKYQKRTPTHMIPSEYTGTLDIGLSSFLFNNSISSQQPGNDTVISSQIKEQPQLSYGFGFDFQLKNKRYPIFLQLGVHIQNYKEKIDYQFIREYIDHEQSYWDCDSIFEYHINPPFFDTVLAGIDSTYMEYVVRNENTKKHTNTYQYLSLPLMLGYQIDRLHSPFKFEFSVGVNLSVLLKNQGYYYNNDGYILDFSSHTTSVDLQYNLVAQIGVYYQWRNINLFVRPYFQYQLNTNEWNPPVQGRKYLVYGLRFGIGFRMF